MDVDCLIVGAGLSGATIAERLASQMGESVLVVEQRDHIAGNAWDEYNNYGILEHKYGPHIFHTNSQKVWNYLSQFTLWRPYFHRVRGCIDGKLVPLPFNLNSIEALFPSEMSVRLAEKLIAAYGYGSRVPVLSMREENDSDIRFLAGYVYRNVFEKYTQKQWGMLPEELSPAVTSRVPLVISRDDRYFQDTYQGMPLYGYSNLVRNMLSHPKIKVMLNTRWQDVKNQISCKRVIFTGPIDEYYEYMYGELPYRSLRFDVQTLPMQQFQDAAVINYPNEYDYTRVTEQKWLTGQEHKQTTILTEYPLQHVVGQTIPYYPIPTDNNTELYNKYNVESTKASDNVLFLGRLAHYKYYNMDQAVEVTLSQFEKMKQI